MEVIFSAHDMRRCDRFAISTLRIPGPILMENAGRSVVELAIKHYGPVAGRHFLICAGTGNNGGDGFVAARHLLNKGATVCLALAGSSAGLRGDAKYHYEPLKAYCRTAGKQARLAIIQKAAPRKLKSHPAPAAVIDALLGTGFSGAPREPIAGLIKAINAFSCPVLSIDIPSGVNADDGSVQSIAVRATITITLGGLKKGLLIEPGRTHAGLIETGDISLPPLAVERASAADTLLVAQSDVAAVLPRRSRQAHKHSVGKIFILAGSVGLTGAAALASLSALRCGAGAVVLGTPRSVYEILAKKLTEVMVTPLAETADGTISVMSLPEISRRMEWADIVILGPGLGRNEETDEVLQRLVHKRLRPMLLDADGLNALGRLKDGAFTRKTNALILTPHSGEFSRLSGVSPDEVERQRFEVSRSFAVKHHLTLVLKGSPTVTATKDARIYVNSSGNAGMATAGSGDVLSGCIGAFMGQGMSAAAAAYAGAYIHGRAGDLAKNRYGEKSLMAGDILECLPDAIKSVEHSNATK